MNMFCFQCEQTAQGKAVQYKVCAVKKLIPQFAR